MPKCNECVYGTRDRCLKCGDKARGTPRAMSDEYYWFLYLQVESTPDPIAYLAEPSDEEYCDD